MLKWSSRQDKVEKAGSVSLTQPGIPDAIMALCRAIDCAGGRAWLVGGWVRDRLTTRAASLPPVDYDIEVYGLSLQALQAIAARFGPVTVAGRQFAVLKVQCGGIAVDLALPRRERNCGVGHRAFEVVADPQMTPEQASCRRDFTVNAMMYDPLHEVLLDPHGGQKDLQAGVLRHVSPAFVEDPLRPLRAMQFCARFDALLAVETAALCRSMLPMAPALPVERVWQEWRKWALSDYPAAGLRALVECGWLDCYPQLQVLADTPQDPRWHPEGDVWQHTMQVCAHAARVAQREALSEPSRITLLFAALCHDLGKPATTMRDDAGVLRSKGHAQQGVEPCHRFMAAIGAPSWLPKQVAPLVREHLVHLNSQPTPRAVRRLACRLQPSNIERWEQLVEADASGRAPNPADRPAKAWLQQAQQMLVTRKPPPPLVTGEWLLAQGMQPGPAVGAMLEAAWQAQLEGELTSPDDVVRWWQQHRSA